MQVVPDWVYFVLLAVQFGLQPTLNKWFIPVGVATTSVIALTELCKIGFSLAILASMHRRHHGRPSSSISSILLRNPRQSLANALLPASLYSVQNWLILASLQYISPLSLSLLNQTKTLSAAFFAYWLLGRRQTGWQLAALAGLMVGASMIVMADANSNNTTSVTLNHQEAFAIGVPLVGVASMLSGLSSACTELALKTRQATTSTSTTVSDITPAMASVAFSIDLAIVSLAVLMASLVLGINPDSINLSKLTVTCLIPLVTSALGGILVGIVTQKFGGVKKGFALILGICLAGVVEAAFGAKHLTPAHYSAVGLVCLSMWLYFTQPTKTTTTQQMDEVKRKHE